MPNTKNNEIVQCKICNLSVKGYHGLSLHLRVQHNMSGQSYYDLYYKKDALEGICPICQKPTVFRGFKRGYLTHCSSKCAGNDPQVIKKTEQTNLEKYGVKAYPSSADFLKKSIITNNKKYNNNWFIGSDVGKKRVTTTNKKRYGTSYPLENNEVKQKSINTQQEKYGGCYMQTTDFREKTKQKVKDKYKTLYYIQTQDFAEKSSKTRQMRHLPGTRTEDGCYNDLCKKFTVVKRQHKTKKYPFFCDFYIPELNLYIECNFFWTHGGHFFNPDDEQDLNTLNLWKTKNTPYYNAAIRNWTVSDRKKKQYALKHDLNYVVVWNKKQFNSFILDLENKKCFQHFIDYNYVN